MRLRCRHRSSTGSSFIWGILDSVQPMERLAKASETLIEAHRRVMAPEGGRWRSGSALATELQSLGPALAHDLAEGARLAQLTFASALDHLAAMAVLLRQEGIVLPTATVCRGVIEAAAVSYYLIDPGESAVERARRYTNERLAALVETRNLAQRVGQDHVAKQRTTQIAELVKAGKRDGHAVTQRRQPWFAPYLGARPPSVTDRVQAILATGDLGRNLYQFLSATAHAGSHGIAQYLDAVHAHDPGDGLVTAAITVSPQSAAIRYMSAPLAVSSAGERLFTAFGWETTDTLLPAQLCLGAWASVAELPVRTFGDSIRSQAVPGSFRREAGSQ